MKVVLKIFTIFIVLVFVISSFTACENKASSQNGQTAKSPAPDKPANIAEQPEIKSEYPPLVSTSSQNGQPEKTPVFDEPANTAEPEKKSEYPPLVSAISQADIHLLDSSTFKLADRKGKVLLLNLWATWCGPCRWEMPHLVELQDAYRNEGFEVIGLNIGGKDNLPESNAEIEKFAEQMKLNYQLARISDSTTFEFSKLTKFEGIPQSLLVDRDGYLRGVFLGGSPRVINTMKQTVVKVMSESSE